MLTCIYRARYAEVVHTFVYYQWPFVAGRTPRGGRSGDQLKGEYSSPGFGCLALLVSPLLAGLGLSMIWVPETGKLLGIGARAGVVVAVVYTVYRVNGHGRYNSRRAGSPWRGVPLP